MDHHLALLLDGGTVALPASPDPARPGSIHGFEARAGLELTLSI